MKIALSKMKEVKKKREIKVKVHSSVTTAKPRGVVGREGVVFLYPKAPTFSFLDISTPRTCPLQVLMNGINGL